MLSHIYFAAHLLEARLIQIHNAQAKHASLIHLSFKEEKRKNPKRLGSVCFRR